MDFREEAFLNGFSEGLEKVGGPRTEAVKKFFGATLKKIKGAPGAAAARGKYEAGKVGRKAKAGAAAVGAGAGKVWHGGQRSKVSTKEILQGLRGKALAKGPESKAQMLPRLTRGQAARVGGTRAAVTGGGALGLGAALKRRKEDKGK